MPNYRQGDVLIFQLKKMPKKKMVTDYGFRPKGDNIIIEGEITGHKHEVVNGKLYEKEGKIVVEAEKGCVLKHPDHNPIQLPAGVFEIRIQEEFDETKPGMKNKVKD